MVKVTHKNYISVPKGDPSSDHRSQGNQLYSYDYPKPEEVGYFFRQIFGNGAFPYYILWDVLLFMIV